MLFNVIGLVLASYVVGKEDRIIIVALEADEVRHRVEILVCVLASVVARTNQLVEVHGVHGVRHVEMLANASLEVGHTPSDELSVDLAPVVARWRDACLHGEVHAVVHPAGLRGACADP